MNLNMIDGIVSGVRAYIREEETKHILGDLEHYSPMLYIITRPWNGSKGKETEITLISKTALNSDIIEKACNVIRGHKDACLDIIEA